MYPSWASRCVYCSASRASSGSQRIAGTPALARSALCVAVIATWNQAARGTGDGMTAAAAKAARPKEIVMASPSFGGRPD